MCACIRYDNVFAQQGLASEPSRVEELTKKGGDLLLQDTHTGKHGSSTQPVNFAKVKQIAVLHCDLINQCLELISGRRNLQRDSRHWPKCLALVRTFT